MENLSKYLNFAQKLADESKLILQKKFRQKLQTGTKADNSPVTEADLAVEERLRSLIQTAFPDHGILGEELALKTANSDYQWSLDPIDGTKNFIAGLPTFSTLIGLRDSNGVCLGVLDMPILNERWCAVRNQGVFFNGKPCKVCRNTDLKQALLFATHPQIFEPRQKANFDILTQQVRWSQFGYDAYAYGLLATGFVDAVVEATLKRHDIVPLLLIVEQAGGVATDWQGESLLNEGWDGSMLAANPALHAQMLPFLQL